MSKEITYSDSIRQSMLRGIDRLADAVKVTLGPKGRNATMHQKAGLRDADYSDRADANAPVLITNDGVTIARSIVLEDPLENMGAEFLKEAATTVNDEAGDGTTTAVLLAQSILHEGFKNVAAGANPIAVRNGIQKATQETIRLLKDSAASISTRDEIARVATVSCENEELGALVAEALDRVGTEGVINVEDLHRYETTLDVMEGIVFERGFLSPVMTTDKNQTVAELNNPYILMCDTTFSNQQDLIPVLMLAAEDDRPILIIAEGVEGEAMALIQTNKVEGDMDIVCIKPPAYGEGRTWRMEDLAVQTGGMYITKDFGLDIRQVTRDMLGSAQKVKVTKDRTVITGGAGDSEAIEKRIQELRYMVEHTDYDFNKHRYEERLAKFVSGVAVIEVGGHTQTEVWEKKMRIEDAVNASRAAIEEGVVPGGGIALLDLEEQVQVFADTLDGDTRTGAHVLAHALSAPARQIAVNAGLDGPAVIAHLKEEPAGTGYDVEQNQYFNMMEAGVVDPVKVTRLALESAASVSATLLTIEVGVSDIH